MAACKNADKDRCLLGTRETENFEGILVLKIEFGGTSFPIGPSAVYPIGRTCPYKSLMRPVSFDRGATCLLRRLSLDICGVVGISSTLNCPAQIDDALRWRFIFVRPRECSIR